jgi:O-antigen ligase
MALAVIGLLLVMEAFDLLLRTDDATNRTAGSPLFQLVSAGIYLSGFALLLVRGIPLWAPRLLVRSWPLLLMTLLPIVSVLWSQNPETSLRRAIALLLSSGFAAFMAIRFSRTQLVQLVIAAFTLYIVFSICAAAVPGVGITPSDPHAGAWRGLSGHKNNFGRTVALATVFLFIAARLNLIGFRRVLAFLAAVAFALLLLSRSATSMVAAVGSLSAGAVLYVGLGGRLGQTRLRPELGFALLLAAALSAALLITYGMPLILTLLGRDPTLTGRTELWSWAIHANESRQWLGSGYRTFWINENTKYFFESFLWLKDVDGELSEAAAGPSHAHSGYVDVYLELGVVGLAVLFAVVASIFVIIRSCISAGRDETAVIFSVLSAFLLIYAVAANSILEQSEDLWFLFTLFYLFSAKEYILATRPRAFSPQRRGRIHLGSPAPAGASPVIPLRPVERSHLR